MHRSRPHWVLVPLAYLALTVLMTWPFALRLGDTLGGGLDPLLQSWVLAWDVHALTTNPLGVWNAPIFAPYGDTLAYSDHHLLLAPLVAPLLALTNNPALAHNLLVLLSYPLSGYAVYRLARTWWGSAWAAGVAGAAFAFCAFRMAQFVHLQMLQTAWLPFALLFFQRTITKGTWRDALFCGLFVAIQCVTALYMSYFAALALGLAGGLWAVEAIWLRIRAQRPLPWPILLKLAVGVLLAGTIVVPLTLPYLRVYASIGVVRSVRELDNWSAPLQAYIAVDPGNWLLGSKPRFTASGGEFALFPGLVVSLLALLGGWAGLRDGGAARRTTLFLLLLAACAGILSLGTGVRLVRGGAVLPIPLPYALLYARLPGFGALRVPARWGLLVDLAGCLLAARGMIFVSVQGMGVAGAFGPRKTFFPPFWAAKPPKRGGIGGAKPANIAPPQRLLVFFAPRRPVKERKAANPLTALRTFAERGVLLPIGVLLLILGESFTTFALTAAPNLATAPPIYAWLGEPAQADIQAVLELPTAKTQRGAEIEKSMRRQYLGMLHWRPLVTGYSGLIPFGTTDLLGHAQRLPDPNAITFLQLAGVDTLVVHRNEYAPDTLQKLTTGLNSSTQTHLRAEVGDALVYTLLPLAERDLPSGTTVYLSSDERVPGMPALALLKRWTAQGVRVYGDARIRYYGPLNPSAAGQVFDYALLAEGEDPQPLGFRTERMRWQHAGMALYARDPALRLNLALGTVPAGGYHPQFPDHLDITVGEAQGTVGTQTVAWQEPLQSPTVELEVASLIAQDLQANGARFPLMPGVTTIALPITRGQTLRVQGQRAVTALVRLRIREGAVLVMSSNRKAIAVESSFAGTALRIALQVGGTGSVLIEARGAAAYDDRPILLFAGTQPIPNKQNGDLTIAIDLLNPREAWITKRTEPQDGRYIVYLKDAADPSATGIPIAKFTIRGGAVAEAVPVPVPLRGL